MGDIVVGISKYNKPEDYNVISQKLTPLAEKYFTAAEDLRNNFQYKESVENYLHSILIDRNNPTSYIGVALSYKNLKEYQKAIVNLQKAELLSPLIILHIASSF